MAPTQPIHANGVTGRAEPGAHEAPSHDDEVAREASLANLEEKYAFGWDVEKCQRCGARMKLRALLTNPKSITRFLRSLGQPTEPPPVAPARGPPFYKSPALRRKLGELDGSLRAQIEMFEP